MSGHTPGPWRVTSPQADPNAYDIESASGTKITRGYWGTSACADARLIAAAPEMLEALCAALREEEKCAMGRGEVPLAPWVGLARAAIAKAEGR